MVNSCLLAVSHHRAAVQQQLFLDSELVCGFSLLYRCQRYGKGIRETTILTESPYQMNGVEIILTITFCLTLKVRKEHLKAAKSLAPVMGAAEAARQRGAAGWERSSAGLPLSLCPQGRY